MRAVKKSTALVVRTRSIWRPSAMLSLAVLGLTVAAVYFISQRSFQKSDGDKGSKAVAIVEEKPVIDGEIFYNSSILGSSLNITSLKTRLFSPAFIRQALRDCGIDSSPVAGNNAHIASVISLEQLRQGLSIRVEPGAESGGNRVVLELTLNQSADAAGIARALADRYVREYQTFWAAEMQEARLAASAQTDQARQTHREAMERLQVFKDKVTEQERMTEKQPRGQPQTAQVETRQTAYNPAWIELNGQIESLRRQEAEMLENKTPLHPVVQLMRGRIADFEQELASTPRFNAEFPAENATHQAISNHRDKISPSENETTETLKRLQADVERSEKEYQIKLHREQRILEDNRKGPVFSVEVNPVAATKTEHKSNRGLIELILLSGVAMAVGISVFFLGVTSEPALATIADLEPLLPAPIIGVVPSKDPSFDPVVRRSRQMICRWSMILLGGLIVLVSIGWVYWGFAHLM